MGRGTLTRAPIQELYDPTFESVANLDDLQRSWETLKNVVGDQCKMSDLIYYFLVFIIVFLF